MRCQARLPRPPVIGNGSSGRSRGRATCSAYPRRDLLDSVDGMGTDQVKERWQVFAGEDNPAEGKDDVEPPEVAREIDAVEVAVFDGNPAPSLNARLPGSGTKAS